MFRILMTTALVMGMFAAGHSAHAQDSMQYPIDVVAAPDGTVYVADRQLPGIWKINDGTPELFFQAEKQFGTPLNAIRCLGIDHEGNLLAGDSATFAVYRFTENGTPSPINEGRIGIPMGIACADDGTVFVSDIELGRIYKIPPSDDGSPTMRELVISVAAPRGICLDDEGRLWIVSAREGQVRRLESDQSTLTTVVEGLAFDYPATIVCLDDAVYVCDSFADTIYRIASDGEPEAWASGEPFVHPVGMSVREGKILVADSRANKIFQVDVDATISEFAAGGQ